MGFFLQKQCLKKKRKEGKDLHTREQPYQIFWQFPYNSLHTTAFWQNTSFISMSNSLPAETVIAF